MKYLFILILISCGKVDAKKNPNPGHRLGGKNKISSIDKVKHLQWKKEFKCWEFDVRSTKDCVVLYHDRKYKDEKVRLLKCKDIKAHTFDEFINNMAQRTDIRKPFCVDLKHIKFSDYLYVSDMMAHFEHKFLMHKTRLPKYQKIVDDIKARGIEVGFYGK